MFSECLQTTANYRQLHPKALACQQILPPSTSTDNNPNATSTSPLGAIYSRDGIVLFPTHAPYKTVSILSHQSCPLSSSSAGSFLSFSTQKSQQKLASTHSDSVLIWDTSLQSLQPLTNRLHYNTDSSGKHLQTNFISLDWNKHDETILTTLSNTVSVWDIRTKTWIRPSSTYTSNGNATILSVASSYVEHEFACMDSCGMVRIYDDRVNHFSKSKSNSNSSDELVRFRAHQAGGLGIESIQSSTNEINQYVSWGMENVEYPMNKSVKVWESNLNEKSNNNEGFHPDAYWNMDDVVGNTKDQNEKSNIDLQNGENFVSYGCCATLTVAGLSNVRICPKPFEEGILTVSSNNSCEGISSWHLNLWSLESIKKSFELENIASYDYCEKVSSNAVGSESASRNLIATELTLGSSSHSERRKGFVNASLTSQDSCEVELLVCCLDDEGYVTTHAVQEAQSLKRRSAYMPKRNDRNISDQHDISSVVSRKKDVKIFQSCSDPDLASHDVRIQRGRGQSDADLHYIIPQAEHASINQLSKVSDFMAEDIDGGFKFRKEDKYLFNEKNKLERNNEITNAPIGNIQIHGKQLTEVGQELDLIDEEALLDMHNMSLSEKIDPIKARNIPCPRLCGATFGIGGGMIIFNNGEVKKMWQWYSDSTSSSNADLPHPMKKMISAESLNDKQHFDDESSGIDSSNNNTSESMMKQKTPDFPRSMWGLMQMNEAAKFAQWGDEDEANEEDISESSPSDEEADISDEDYSDESSSSSYDIISVGENIDTIANSGTMKDSYFDKEDYGLPKYTSPLFEKGAKSRRIFAPATESLAPQIFYTAIFNNTILNGQSPELADVWIFGPWHEKHDILSHEAIFLNRQLQSPGLVDKEGKYMERNTIDQLNYTKAICLHNGREALELVQKQKAGVWFLLAQALDNVSSTVHSEYDGWCSFISGALGQIMLDEILKYYEFQGDVQMLATIMTVIGGGLLGIHHQDIKSLYIDPRRSDSYIHSYANMLYSWGRIEACAELRKHLHFYSNKQFTQLKFASYAQQNDRVLKQGSFDFREKEKSAFQCSLCRLPVRGLFTVCLKCGHGGHLQHYIDWFSDNSVCPTGCECTCSLVNVNAV